MRDIALDNRFANRNYVYVAAQHPSNPSANGVYYSTNQGSVFTRIGGIPLGDTVVSMIIVRDSSLASAGFADRLNVGTSGFADYLIVGTSNGKIYKATLSAVIIAFNLVYSITGNPEVAAFWSIYAGTIAYIYAGGFDRGGGGGGVLESINRGAWAGIDQGLPPERKIAAIAGTVAVGNLLLYTGMFLNQNAAAPQNAVAPVGAPVYRRTVTITDVKEGSSELPRDFALLQNYPNPFNPETQIRFQLPEATHVVVKIYNILGKEIVTLADGLHDPGYYALRWDGKDKNGSSASTGVYFYRIQAGKFSEVRKMVLLR